MSAPSQSEYLRIDGISALLYIRYAQKNYICVEILIADLSRNYHNLSAKAHDLNTAREFACYIDV